MHLLLLLLRNPIRAFRFLYTWWMQSSLVVLRRILLPHIPHYQSLRLQLQRAYLLSCSTQFPDLTFRLPIGRVPDAKAKMVGGSFDGYLIPGSKSGLLHEVAGGATADKCVILYAHGGGYARGEAKMYIKYMERWERVAKEMGVDIVFLSVEYPLTDAASHPAQRDAFLCAYEYLLLQGVPASNILLMGDSAGGGNCILSSFECLKRNLPQPAGSILISPWLDPTMRAHEGGNPIVETDYVIGANGSSPVLWRTWLNGIPSTSPDVNPLLRPIDEVRNINPQLILVGGGEFARQEGQAWAELCAKSGVRYQYKCEWGQLHNFALGSSWVDPAVRQAMDEAIVGWMRVCSEKSLDSIKAMGESK